MLKNAYIFDLDDTLIKSKSLIYIYNEKSELIDKINSEDYVKKRGIINDYYKKGYNVDTHEFGGNGDCLYSDRKSHEFLLNGHILHNQVEILKNVIQNNSNNVYIVTGRANQPETLKRLLNEKFNINIPINNIYPVSNKEKMNLLWMKIKNNTHYGIIDLLENGKNAKNYKKIAFYDILRKKYEYVSFYDDDPENIDCFDNIIKELNNIGFNIKSKSYLIK